MAKIVILASGDDATAVSAALDPAGLDYEIVDPKPANLLHMVIGMVGDDEDESAEEEPTEDEAAPEEPEEEIPADDSEIAADASGVPESFGIAKVDGEPVDTIAIKEPHSILFVPTIDAGAKTTYSINESTFSFWPANVAAPAQRMIVERDKHRASIEIVVKQGKTKTAYLGVGEDLVSLFKTK